MGGNSANTAMSEVKATRFGKNMGNFLGNGQPGGRQAQRIPDACSFWRAIGKMEA